jgi:hypothetical protein
LTTTARQSVAGATNAPCAKTIVMLNERSQEVQGVQVWGDAAQVRLPDDVLFLRQVAGVWQVSAAGCTRQPVGPYDCTVS